MHKNTKEAFASTTAALLLLGGAGTLASWNDSDTIGGGAIESGKLSLTQESGQACTAWALDAIGGGGAFVPGTTLVVPGDVITRTCTYTYSWPSKDFRYTYRAQLVDSTGTIRRTDIVPESGQSGYAVTYAAGDLPDGNFTVRVSSSLTGSTTWTSTTTTSAAGSNVVVLFVGLTTACRS